MPFSSDQFLHVFETYNTAVFPMQIFFNLLALLSIILTIKKTKYSNKIIGCSLALLWIWIGVVYHLIFFSEINPAAKIFAVIFIIEGLLLFYFITVKEIINFNFQLNSRTIIGIFLIIYALIIYPMIGRMIGHSYPRNPTFGLPCPTTIFTFGLLLWSENKVPWYLFVLPLAWSLLGFTAALNFGIWEDTGLLISGILSVIIFIFSKPRPVLKLKF